jgi:hypothetical protein
MATHDERLQRHFRDLSDDALLSKIDSGDLTEDARRAALAEAQARAFDLDAARAQAAAEADARAEAATARALAKAEAAAKAAEARDAAADATGSLPPRSAFAVLGEVVAWLYFTVMLAALTYLGFTEAAISSRVPQSTVLLFAATMTLDAIACVGYWGWLQQRRIAVRALWVICASAKTVEVIAASVSTLAARDFKQFLLLGFGLPLLLAVWHYALAPSGPWGTRRRTA